MKAKNKKRGRPLESPLPRDTLINLRLNSREAECLQMYSWRYDVSMSEVIRQALMILSIIPENTVHK